MIHCLNNSKNLEATVHALQNKIVTLTKRSNFLCRKITGRPALSLSFYSRHHIATPRAHNHSSAIASRNHDQYTHNNYPCCSKTYRPRKHNMLDPTTLEYIRDLVEETINQALHLTKGASG